MAFHFVFDDESRRARTVGFAPRFISLRRHHHTSHRLIIIVTSHASSLSHAFTHHIFSARRNIAMRGTRCHVVIGHGHNIMPQHVTSPPLIFVSETWAAPRRNGHYEPGYYACQHVLAATAGAQQLEKRLPAKAHRHDFFAYQYTQKKKLVVDIESRL